MAAKLQFLDHQIVTSCIAIGKCGLFTLYLKGNDMKNSKFGKSWILYMYTVGPQCKIFNYGLQEETHGCQMTEFW